MKVCLVVDDAKVIRVVAREIISGFGFGIEEAEDGEGALEYCRVDMPDVILLDWNMPIMNGIEFLKKLRKLSGGDEPVVIFCTTETGIEHIQQAMEEGANEYVMKPFDSDIMRSKFEQLGLLDD